MKISKFIIFFLFGVIIVASNLQAQGFRNVGHSGANFLQIPVEPTGAALGNSIVANSNGVRGLYWNPSAITESQGTEVLLSTVDWVIDTRLSFLGLTQKFSFGTIGFSVTALTMDDMEITTERNPNGTGEYFGAGDYAFGLTYATKIIDRFSFGGTVKYIYEYIWETNGSAIAFDFGSTYWTDFYNFRIGMRLANFGGSITFSGDPIDNKPRVIEDSGLSFQNDPRLERVSEDFSLPQLFNVGVAADPLDNQNHKVTVSFAVIDPNDNQTQVIFGTEYGFQDFVFLRGGYKAGYEVESFSFGFGVKYDIADLQTHFDYGYSDFGVLGNINFIALRIGL